MSRRAKTGGATARTATAPRTSHPKSPGSPPASGPAASAWWNGESGIQTVREILRRIDAPVIFVTGFPERLLTGEDLEPAFVITKPFNPQTLKTAIAQALSLSRDPARQR